MSLFNSPFLPFRYYLLISVLMIITYCFKIEITELLITHGKFNIHPTNLVILVNVMLLFYIPIIYGMLYVIDKMLIEKHHDPKYRFMDPYEYWKLTHRRR